MSDRQIAFAAAHGRLVTFRFLNTMPHHEVRGYVTGMDDFKWMVASPPPAEGADQEVTTCLVHKSVDLVVIDNESTLATLPDAVLTAITAQGSPFWTYCKNHLL